MWLELFLILLFIILNGFFAASEVAVITARKTRIHELAKHGRPNAIVLETIQKAPDRFLATVQVGVTLLGALASAVGGATAVERLKPVFLSSSLEFVRHAAGPIAIGCVVGAITFLSVIIGELAPKSIALRSPERVALFVAIPVNLLSKMGSFAVRFLAWCTDLILRPFGIPPVGSHAYYSEDEVKQIIQEGREQGIFEETEQKLIHSAIEFADISAREVLVPVTRMVAIEIDTPMDEIMRLITTEHFSRYPVYEKEINNIRGILYQKDVLTHLVHSRAPNIRELLHKAYFVPESIKISHMLKVMQRGRTHLAVVLNEYGGVAGMVTIEDLIEELVGEIKDEYDDESPVQRVRGGALIAEAGITIRDMKDNYNVDLPDSEGYETIGGLLLAELQRIPHGGETVEVPGWKLTIVDMDGKRIAKVRIEAVKAFAETPPEKADRTD
jgi:putative hemolysin